MQYMISIQQRMACSMELLAYDKTSWKHAYIFSTPLNPTFRQYIWGFQRYALSIFFCKNIDCGYSLSPPHRSGLKKNVCVEVLRPSQPNGVMSSAVSLPNHTFTGQA